MHGPAIRFEIGLGGRGGNCCRRSGWPVIGAILLAGLASGCRESPVFTDSAVVFVSPGRGATNLCEVGMKYSEVRKATRDATRHGLRNGSWTQVLNHQRGTFALVPSLGAIASIGEDQPISIIEFYVRPFREQLIPGLEIRHPFRGKLGGLSFGDGPVEKAQVEAIYGRATHTITNAGDSLDFRRNGEAFLLRPPNGIEEQWYPAMGVAFTFETNVVRSFQVFRPAGTNQ